MWYGIVLTICIELCLFVTYIVIRARKEIKEEEQGKTYFIDEDLYI
jgi:hypothetical protein